MLQELNIIISEDEKFNFLLLKKLLSKTLSCSINITHAINGQEAIDACKQNTDLILMDVEMPIMNGLDASKIIKEKYPNIPIIIQTAHCTKEQIEKAKNIGCDAFLSKPIIRKDFENVLAKFLPVNID